MDEGSDLDGPFIYRLNDNGSGPSLLVKVCAERGWRMYQNYNSGEDRWNLWWRTGAFPAACYKTLGDWQFMNHIPKGGSICRKDNLSRLLRCMRKIYGSIYDFSPPAYHLPLEYAKLVSECSRLRRGADDAAAAGAGAVWIHKPVGQSQGRGIFLFRSVCEMRCGGAAVAQRYIERPLLVAGYKFDLRLYVCVPAYRPLTAYLYAEGLARFGTDKYTLSDIHNPYRHLTNSSLNKSGPRYAECKDRIGNGCKWTLKQVRRALRGRGGSAEWLAWQRVRALVELTLLAQAAGTPPARNCFEFYGFDVLLDDTLKPWLLEVNLSPALAADCEADVAVKRPMLHELFDLLGLPMRHTGLTVLRALPITNQPSSDEEAKEGRPRTRPTQARAGTSGANRRGTRWRRSRRSLPLHCITLQPPDNVEIDEKYKENLDSSNDSKTSSRDSTSDPLEESTSSGTTSMPECGVGAEDKWQAPKGGKRTAASCSAWGNGVCWDRAPGRVGKWVRIYPHSLPRDDQVYSMDDVREGVTQVSKFARAAREVARDTARDARPTPRDAARDATLEAALRDKLAFGPHFQVWLPQI